MNKSYGIQIQEIDPDRVSSIIELRSQVAILPADIGRLTHLPEVFLGSGELGTAIGETVRNIIYSAYLIQ